MDRTHDPAHPDLDAGALNVLGHVAQRIEPGEVDVGDGIADEDERVQRRPVFVEEAKDRLMEVVRVAEEDRRLEAHDQHALARLGLGMAADIAMSPASADLPQHGDARAREAVQDGQQRDEHADEDAVEDPEHRRMASNATSAPRPIAAEPASIRSTRWPNPPSVVWKVLVVTPLTPRRFGSCAAMMTSDIAAVEADQHRPREQVREEPEVQRPREQHDRPRPQVRDPPRAPSPGTCPCAIGAIAAAVRIELVGVGPACAWRIEPANP